MTTPNDPTMSHDSLDAVIAGYMLAVEKGDVPNRQDLLDRHPEHADALRAFFADLDRMDRVASPLRLAGGLEATSAVDANGHAAPQTIRYFGDYELFEEIARGGMGIVYKARQVSLNRLVALKMILAGSFASSREVQRFRSEAEAAANLDHPQIVPIYEVGEHEGQQYYSMKFVEGTSLAKHARGDARTEVEGMVGAIRAVHHAHQRGVLHRDLKPSNLLVDSQGTLLVTDFGLAKRLAPGDGSFTETGQVLGTPKYMAPEQAAGRKDLTVAADVYSLGVILYERLTGQTPFTGDNALTLLRQARESEPPRLSTIQPGLDRDLETVVLKCLEKEPERRYPSAEALGGDLARWLRGEPIQARPVGQPERLWRWCRRNPVVSGLMAAVAAALVIGIVASTFFAFKERRERNRAEAAEKRALDAREDMEGLLARSLAKPLNPEGEDNETLSLPETESLWELARLRATDIGLRFLEEATRDAVSMQQLRGRSEPAVIAAVGLDPQKRVSALDRVLRRLRQADTPPAIKADAALLALELVDQDRAVTEACSIALLEALATDPSERVRSRWIEHLASVSDRLEPEAAARILIAVMERGKDPNTIPHPHERILTALTSLSNRMAPTEAAALFLSGVERSSDAFSRCNLAIELAALARRLPPEVGTGLCRRAAEVLVAALRQEADKDKFRELALGLAFVVARLDSITADRMTSPFLRRIQDSLCGQPEDLLLNLAGRIPPTEAANRLVVCLGELVDVNFNMDTDIVLQPLRSNVSGGRVKKTSTFEPLKIELLAYQIESELHIDNLNNLMERMGQTGTTHVWKSAAEVLSAALNDPSSEPQRTRWALRAIIGRELATVARWLDRSDSSRICRQPSHFLVDDLKREANPIARGAMAESTAMLADRLEPSESARICSSACQVLCDALRQANDPIGRDALLKGIAMLASRMDRAEAGRLCAQALSVATHDGNPESAEPCASLVKQIGSHESLRMATSALEAQDGRIPGYLAAGLEALAASGQMEPTDAVPVLTRALRREESAEVRQHLATALAEVSRRTSPAAAASACAPAAQRLAEALAQEKDADDRGRLTVGLASLCSRIGAAEASRICAGAIRHLLVAGNSGHDELDSESDQLAVERDVLVLLPLLDEIKATNLARAWVTRFCSEPFKGPFNVNGEDVFLIDERLYALLRDTGRSEKTRRAARMAAVSFAGAPLAAVQVAAEPFPCRLTTQELVELLKMPTSFGPARRVVLDHLGSRYGRRFVNRWAFVRFAKEQKMQLDLTTPPKRPDPKRSLERMLAILDDPSAGR